MKALGMVKERHTNVVLAVVFIALAVYSIHNAVRYHQPLAVVYFLIHLTIAVEVLVRRETIARSPFYPGYLAAIVAVFYIYLYDFSVPLSPLWRLAEVIGLVGAVAALLALISLGRCYGIFPSYRGVKSRFMYRIVRHPIYASYIVMDIGIVLAHPSARNWVIFVVAIVALLVRVHYEELVLRQDPAYVAYAARVPHRLVPFVY